METHKLECTCARACEVSQFKNKERIYKQTLSMKDVVIDVN